MGFFVRNNALDGMEEKSKKMMKKIIAALLMFVVMMTGCNVAGEKEGQYTKTSKK